MMLVPVKSKMRCHIRNTNVKTTMGITKENIMKQQILY